VTYTEATDWLFNQLPMFQRQGAAAYKTDLDGTWRVLEMLGRPDLRLPHVIHVAGTNGKGSVCTAIANALEVQNLRVGLFTSPHLVDYRERMRVNGSMPSESWVTDFVSKHRQASEELEQAPSFFEWTFGMALCYFLSCEVDVVVLETGMGGRLDSTNIFPNPLLTVITNVGMDHQQFLGNDIRSIAKEKAGIVKEGVPVVMGRMRPEAQSVVLETANRLGAETHYAAPAETADLEGHGPHWPENRATAHKALEVLTALPFGKGLQLPKVDELTKDGHAGRWHWLNPTPAGAKVLVECAHNLDGLGGTLSAISTLGFSDLHIVFGAVSDKELSEVFELLPVEAHYYFCAANIPRALPARALGKMAEQAGLIGGSFASVREAYAAACAEAQPSALVLVFGSIFIAAEVLAT
jgi:dihydrofolate synthase / folylpolyglutamate synthase